MSGPPPASSPDAAAGSGDPDGSVDSLATDVPVVLVHGINGSSADFEVMRQRLIDSGWAEDHVLAITYDDPSWGCNVDNAQQLSDAVHQLMADTGSDRVNVVAHSMGTLSSRYFIKDLGGSELVNTYVTLGGPHHGLGSSCSPDFPFKPCVWTEMCSSGDFIAELNADPATPGELSWVSIYSTGDAVVPNGSSHLDGAENIEVDGVSHTGLVEDAAVYAEVDRVLRYPRW